MNIFKTLTVLLTLSLYVYAAMPISPDNYFPDENLTKPYEINIEEPKESNTSFTIVYPTENGRASFYSLPSSNDLERNDTYTGNVGFTREYNMSNPSDLDKWLSSQREVFSKRATEISAKVRETTGFNNSTDSQKGIAALSSEYIYENSDQNSTKRKIIDSVDEIYKNLMSKLSNKKQIKCYVSRVLKPGYMCPLPTKDNFILGYAQHDNKLVSIQDCNKRCKINKECVSKSMPFNDSAYNQINQNLYINNVYTFMTNDRQLIKSVNFKITLSDLNQTKIDNDRYFFRYKTEYYFQGMWHSLYRAYKVNILDENINIKFYINRSAEKIRITIHNPFEKLPESVEAEVLLRDNKHTFVLKEMRVEYDGIKHWFCPNTQYIELDEDPELSCKHGSVKEAPTGSSVRQICIPNNLASYRDEEYGGYKSRYMCEIECFVKEECIPTYRHPSMVDDNGYIPPNKYDIEIGCADEIDNVACTNTICKDLYLKDSRPILEKIWTNNDDIVTTIENSARVPNVQRPKIDIAAELSSNSQDKTKVFKNQMKDSAYVSMIERGTYNVSSMRLNEVFPTQSAYEFKMDKYALRSSLDWLLKGKSNEYDNGKNYYFYPVLAVDVVYHPIKALAVGQNIVYASEDPKIRAIDRLFLIKSPNSWKIFKRAEYIKVYVPDKENKYSWRNASASADIDNVTFDNGEFKAFDMTQLIVPDVKKKFNSSLPYERFNISLDMKYMLSQIPGILFVSQSNIQGRRVEKVFSNSLSDIDESKRAFIFNYAVYGLYYDHQVSYSKIESDFLSHQFFDFQERLKFNNEIKSETLYSDEKIKMYMHGESSNFSVNAEFNPTSSEEGKKAFFFIFLHDK